MQSVCGNAVKLIEADFGIRCTKHGLEGCTAGPWESSKVMRALTVARDFIGGQVYGFYPRTPRRLCNTASFCRCACSKVAIDQYHAALITAARRGRGGGVEAPERAAAEDDSAPIVALIADAMCLR